MRILAVAGGLVFCTSLPSRAEIVVHTVPSPARGVSASTHIGADSSSQSISINFAGLFSNNASADVSAGGFGIAGAEQTSSIPDLQGPLMFGSGSAFGAVLPDPGNTGGYAAESFFDVFFEVTLPENYSLRGQVAYSTPSLPNSGASSVSLIDVTNNNTLFNMTFDAANPGNDAFNLVLTLSPGVTYRMIAFTTTSADNVPGDVFSLGSGAWLFQLRAVAIVPEPNSCILALLSAVVLVPRCRRARPAS